MIKKLKLLVFFIVFVSATTLLGQSSERPADLPDKKYSTAMILTALGKGTAKGAAAMTMLLLLIESHHLKPENTLQKVAAIAIYAGIPIALLLKGRYFLPPRFSNQFIQKMSGEIKVLGKNKLWQARGYALGALLAGLGLFYFKPRVQAL